MSTSKTTATRKKLPPHLEEKDKLVVLTNEAPTNTRNLYYSGVYRESGVDNSFDLDIFKESFKINRISCNSESLVFDMIGVDAPVANAFRRILIAEVPTIAIEKVCINNNTSIMQDEVLSHRLGLIPIKVDPRLFTAKSKDSPPDVYLPTETLVFQLKKRCTKNPNPKNDTIEEKYINSSVYSGDLEWVPQEGQSHLADLGIAPVDDKILILKLRPGQEIDILMYCVKSIGRDHAKFSPVATATYRLLPQITFNEDVIGKDAQDLVELCPMKVFDIEDLGKQKRAVVSRPRNCTVCRECIRPEKFTSKIKLARVKSHFIFSVESTGSLPPRVLFQEAVKELMNKCTSIETQLDRLGSNKDIIGR